MVASVSYQPSRSIKRRGLAAFSILEVMIASGVLVVALGSVFALNSLVMNYLRRGATASFASQLIQERMEQFRRASWTELTSNYPPNPDDPNDVGYDADDDGTYVDDVYPTEFPYDIADLDSLTPGLKDVMAVAMGSAAQLPNLTERVTVECYNASNNPITIFDADGTQITIDPFEVGGTPIVVERSNGVVTTVSNNGMMVFNSTVRLNIAVSWKGTDNVTRKKETVTLFTVEGDK
ncbi:MAG: hypothetical protein DMF06_04640 [Verrucomicrobia bacterium]|jgi:hypothetical protein|nr:MAG: hypothetical protein DMF06_04640 [Verrucomicrobiota bacterium]